jgi:hypothetical protein
VPNQIEQKCVESLRPADRNPRKHPQKQIEQLAARYKKVGFTKPLLVRHDGRIIAGHGRWEAAKLADLKTIPLIVAPNDWSDQQCRKDCSLTTRSATAQSGMRLSRLLPERAVAFQHEVVAAAVALGARTRLSGIAVITTVDHRENACTPCGLGSRTE